MLKTQKGITLIALVVTIVVLLILAGVTISLLLDENGIIAKSKDARLENRASQVEDEIGMWKQNNFINKESDQAQEEANTILESLITRKLLTEDEIDREQEIITIKKKDGSILKQISYSQVTINISKYPETEKSGAVILTVDSVEGMTSFENVEEYKDFLDALSEEQQKEIIRRIEPLYISKHEMQNNIKTQYTTFKEALEWHKEQGNIPNATEEEFWNWIENSDGITERLRKDLYYISFEDADGRLICCMITNPDGETSNTYIATENGTYTFKVKDNVTGKTYTKKVEVTNIDKSLPTNVVTTEFRVGWTYIKLFDVTNKEYIQFEEAYIIYNNEKIDITSLIDKDEGYRISPYKIGDFLSEKDIINRRSQLSNTNQTIILVKDGIEYTGVLNMGKIRDPE